MTIVKEMIKSENSVKTFEEEVYESRRFLEERTSLLTGEVQFNKY